MFKVKIALFVFCSFFYHLTYAAPQYIDFIALDKVVNSKVSNVKANTNVLPVITWGGDIATILAAGNSKTTQKNSIFANQGLNYRLVREDVFSNQVKNYMQGETAFLRGTLGMINSAAKLLNQDERTKPVVFYQLTWSAGGDALVVKNNIKNAQDLKGKTIAVQAYGPHIDYLMRVLQDAGLSVSDVKIKWLKDLTATDNSPMSAFYEQDVDAAFVIIPDALALTSGGNVGTGSEDSVAGAKILMSTKTANRVIGDVYAVRSDYLKNNPEEIEKLTKALMLAEEELKEIMSGSSSNVKYKSLITNAADILLDSKEATADIEGLYLDCEFVHFSGNVKFFTDDNYNRNFEKLNLETSQSLKQLQLSDGQKVEKIQLNYKKLDAGLKFNQATSGQRFNKEQVSAVINKRQQQGSLSDGEIYSFEVFFSPNQNSFTTELYQKDFDRIIELSSIYGGAIITVEGHSDPMGYLRSIKNDDPAVILNRIKQSAKNLSISRAIAVREAIYDYSVTKKTALDRSQFEPIGHGILQPATGICGDYPCVPENEEQWRSNMRVVFRLIQVEAESNVFMPL